ncbi:hypothetical protein GN958_ATG22770 [Phytophthora infestans]|uniref:Uncharacterized protein n=1 Tax=Phytophthora infestans TaxID=4787 RepID=A0A8S9TK34_PHYIN|nr:hypothetical protein GN958_ATG22770 [Phytophthora infestans]
MARTKNTACILRVVDMEVSPSSSSDADNLLDDTELQVSSGSMMMTETVLDGVPNAQNTGDIAGPTRDVGGDKADNNLKDNSDENSDAADSGDLQSSDNDDSSEPDPEKRRAAKLLRLRLAAAESVRSPIVTKSCIMCLPYRSIKDMEKYGSVPENVSAGYFDDESNL